MEKPAIFPNEDIRVIIKFLLLQKKKPKEIIDEINSTAGQRSVSSATVYKWIKVFEEGTLDCSDRERCGRPKKDGLIPSIELLLRDDPYQSARSIASELHVDKNTVSRMLREEMGMKKVNFHWIPHELTDRQKIVRVDIAKEMLRVLSAVRYHSLVLTGDETFLYWKNPRNSVWQHENLPQPSKERKTVGSMKLMISVIWTTSGMKSIVMLPRNQQFNRNFFVNVVLADLFKTIETQRPVKGTSELKFHLDNARPHLVDDVLVGNGLERLPHPPYSPDLAPSDFFLFGYLKKMLEGKNFESDEDLFAEACKLLREIPVTTLRKVYHEWIIRLQRCIQLNGDFVE